MQPEDRVQAIEDAAQFGQILRAGGAGPKILQRHLKHAYEVFDLGMGPDHRLRRVVAAEYARHEGVEGLLFLHLVRNHFLGEEAVDLPQVRLRFIGWYMAEAVGYRADVVNDGQ